MGEDAEGAAESVTQLQQQIQILSGVDIMDTEDSFKSTYQIMKELSAVWGTLTDKSRADITRLVAGVRQGNALDALMKNMKTGMKATETSMDSAGSATEENQKQLESIRGKMTQFQAAFESLSNSIVNSDLIKRIVDGGTLVLGILDKIISSVHTLPALATAAAGALAAIGNKGKLIVHMPFCNKWKHWSSKIQSWCVLQGVA